MKNIEQILKENLRTNVELDKGFKNELRAKLGIEPVKKKNIFSTIVNIFKKDSMKKSTVALRKPALFFASLVGLVLISTLGYFGYQSLLEEGDLGKFSSFATLYINSGEVEVTRGGERITYTSDTELEAGDIVATKEDTIADISTDFGRLALDSNSKTSIDEVDGVVSAEVLEGIVFASTASDFEESVTIKTANADVVIKGAALISQEVETVEVASSRGFFSNLVSKAYAQGDSKVGVTCVNGDVKIVQDGEELVVEVGKHVDVTIGGVSDPSEADRGEFKTDFYDEVIEKELEDGNDLGSAKDLTPPELTIVSPTDGTKFETTNVEVSFKSNEDGWYYDGSTWFELEKEETYKKLFILKDGVNKLEVMVKDAYYNKTSKTISVTYTYPIAMTWETYPVGEASGIYMEWDAKGAVAGEHVYKVYRNGAYYTSYNVIAASELGAWWSDENTTKGKSYSYQIKLYQGSTMLAETRVKSAVSQTYVEPVNTCSISVWKTTSASNMIRPAIDTGSGNYVKWQLTGDCPDYDGYKVVWNTGGSPVYPGDAYSYKSGQVTTGLHEMPAGTWYVRVGLYKSGTGIIDSIYSNQLHDTF